MNTYVAIWHGHSIEIQAESLYRAKLEAIRQFKPNKKQESLISVTLCKLADGTQVLIAPESL